MKSGLTVERYGPDRQRAWDAFVATAKNATFLFKRGYMDYHAARFADHSLIVLRDGVPLALLPANERDGELVSHGGLTYGGFICDHRMRAADMMQVFDTVLATLSALKIAALTYKPVPHIYHRRPAEEDLYALFRLDARLETRAPSASIDLDNDTLPGKKRNGARHGLRHGLRIRKVDDPAPLMALIDANLRQRHGVGAVHSGEEMTRLRAAFPQSIEVFHAEDEAATVQGGAIVYVGERVAHVQYLLATESGRALRVMDVLVDDLVERYRGRCRWFDFGISSEQGGRVLNEALMSQKEEFGAFTVCYDSYRIVL